MRSVESTPVTGTGKKSTDANTGLRQEPKQQPAARRDLSAPGPAPPADAPALSLLRTPRRAPGVASLRAASVVQLQRTHGNRYVQKLLKSPVSGTETTEPAESQVDSTPEAAGQPQINWDEKEAPPSPSGNTTSGVLPANPRVQAAIVAPKIQRAWYNVQIPFTDYELDPSPAGLKTAASLAIDKAKQGATFVKDKVVEAAEWVIGKLKGLISAGIEFLTGKFDQIRGFAESSFAEIKGAVSGALDAITNPLGTMKNALSAMNTGILSAAWRALTAGAAAARQAVKTVVDGVLKSGEGLWATVSGYVDSLFGAVDSLLNSTAFSVLPGVIQNPIKSLYGTVHDLWKSIRDFWTDFWKRLTSFVKDLIESVDTFVQKVLSYGIDQVIETVRKLKEVYDFVKRFVDDPEAVISPIIASIGGKIQAEAPGKAKEVARQKMAEALPSAQRSAPSRSASSETLVHRSPTGTGVVRGTATHAEVDAHVNRELATQWAKLNIPKMLWDSVVNMFWPPATVRAIGHEFYELWNTDWTDTANSLFAPRSIVDDFGGFWHDVWSNFLILLDFPMALWRRLNSILMLLMGYVTIILTLVGLVGGAIAGNVPGAIAGAVAGAQLAFVTGEALFLSFLIAESATVLKAFLDLYTARETDQEKQRKYLQIAASALGIGVAVVVAVLFTLLGALVRDVVGRIKGAAPAPGGTPSAPKQLGPGSPDPASPPGTAPAPAGPNPAEQGAAQPDPAQPQPLKPYDPAIRTDAELVLDSDPTPKAGETPEQAQRRVVEAEDELTRRKMHGLGEVPREVDVRADDAKFGGQGAHTIINHGSDIPLKMPRDAAGNTLPTPTGTKSIEGRIFGDTGWNGDANASFKWKSDQVMNQTVNNYLKANWDKIRLDLAVNGRHANNFTAPPGAVGEGFFNPNQALPGPLPRVANFMESNLVRIVIVFSPGPPADFFIQTTFPNALGAPAR